MQHVNKNMTNYLVRFRNAEKVNKACNVSLMSRGVQEHGMKILYLVYLTIFDVLSENNKKEAEKAGE